MLELTEKSKISQAWRNGQKEAHKQKGWHEGWMMSTGSLFIEQPQLIVARLGTHSFSLNYCNKSLTSRAFQARIIVSRSPRHSQLLKSLIRGCGSTKYYWRSHPNAVLLSVSGRKCEDKPLMIKWMNESESVSNKTSQLISHAVLQWKHSRFPDWWINSLLNRSFIKEVKLCSRW